MRLCTGEIALSETDYGRAEVCTSARGGPMLAATSAMHSFTVATQGTALDGGHHQESGRLRVRDGTRAAGGARPQAHAGQ